MITSPRIARKGGRAEPSEAPQTTVLDETACWRLLDGNGIGRLAISTADGADIFPLNYLSRHGRVYFRSAPGGKIVELTQHPRIAFEVDGRTLLAHWSVVVRGTVRRLQSEPEILRSGIQALQSWQPGEKFNYFEIVPERISGRFIRPRD